MLKDYQHSGAIYAAVPPTLRATRAAGTWESVEITAQKSLLTVYVNGQRVIHADLDELTKSVDTSKPLRDRPRQGYLGLESYGTGAKFRNVRVKKI